MYVAVDLVSQLDLMRDQLGIIFSLIGRYIALNFILRVPWYWSLEQAAE